MEGEADADPAGSTSDSGLEKIDKVGRTGWYVRRFIQRVIQQ